MFAQLNSEGLTGSTAPARSCGREHSSPRLGRHPGASSSCALYVDSGPPLHLIVQNVFLGIKEQVQSAGDSLVQAFCVPSVRILPSSALGGCLAVVWNCSY